MTDRLCYILCFGSLLLGMIYSCARRGTGEINVDEIQNRVDQIEGHIRSMREALKGKDLKSADDEYEEAKEVMTENQTELEAYPEMDLVEKKMVKAESDLCYGHVNIALETFFSAIRNRELEVARSLLEKSQQALQSCDTKINKREDFVALKLNLDSAPNEISKLERELNREGLVREIQTIEQEMARRTQSIEDNLAALEKKANSRELAVSIDEEIRAIRSSLQGRKDYNDLPEWKDYMNQMTQKLNGLEDRRLYWVRRGKILWNVETVLPRAFDAASRAVTVRTKSEALNLFQTALNDYQQCESMVKDSLKEEPKLETFSFLWKGKKKNVAWLKVHCEANRKIAEQMLKKYFGKKVEVEKPAEAPPKKTEPPPTTKSTKPKTTKPKPDPNSDRRNIRRW